VRSWRKGRMRVEGVPQRGEGPRALFANEPIP
jgi:hypothetical protein